jgi:8-oxo-dGTP diphosphatase
MFPKIGVSVICLAKLRKSNIIHSGHVALIRRATQPALGMWSFPGGKLKFGETIADCAIREFNEEVGSCCSVNNMNVPAFAVTDSITYKNEREISFHYAVLHVFATIEADVDTKGSIILPTLIPGDDADDASWFNIKDLCHQDVSSCKTTITSSGRQIDRSLLVPKMNNVISSLQSHLSSLSNIQTRIFNVSTN